MFLYYELGRDLQFIFLSRRMHKAQQGFTLIEVVIALTLFSFVIIGIITAVNRAYAYVQQARLNVIAMNLTREGMEMIYNIRDTNRRVWAGLKDGYWLKRDPFTTPSEIMTPGYYSISSNIKNMQVYPMLELQYSLDASAYYDMDNILTDPEVSSKFKVSFTGYVYSGTEGTPISWLMAKEADFYRMVKVMGIYDKKGTPNSLADNTTVQESLSHQGEPYELRFCVKTFYAGGAQRGSTELCGLMTNFKE